MIRKPQIYSIYLYIYQGREEGGGRWNSTYSQILIYWQVYLYIYLICILDLSYSITSQAIFELPVVRDKYVYFVVCLVLYRKFSLEISDKWSQRFQFQIVPERKLIRTSMSFHTQLNRISYNGDKEERQRERERERERKAERTDA